MSENVSFVSGHSVGFLLYFFCYRDNHLAGVAELVDAPGLGPGGSNPVEVQVLSPAHEMS